jgi:hypothetical protein
MTGAVRDKEFFQRRAAGSVQAAEVTPEHATIAGLLLARAEDDGTALLFEDRRWSWRELVREAATRSALLQRLRPEDPAGRPWHVGVLLENTPEYIFLIAGQRYVLMTADRKRALAADYAGHGRDHLPRL